MSTRLWPKKDDIGSDRLAERESRVLWRSHLSVILAHNETVPKLSFTVNPEKEGFAQTHKQYIRRGCNDLLEETAPTYYRVISLSSGEVRHSMQYHSYVACYLSLFGGERRSRTLLREMYGNTVISAATMLCNPLSRPYIIYDTGNRPNFYRY